MFLVINLMRFNKLILGRNEKIFKCFFSTNRVSGRQNNFFWSVLNSNMVLYFDFYILICKKQMQGTNIWTQYVSTIDRTN